MLDISWQVLRIDTATDTLLKELEKAYYGIQI